MATERKFAAKRLPLTMAFTVLLVAALGAGCKGFFQNTTLNSVAIQPPTPQIQVGPTTTATLQAWGTYSDNTRSQITSGVSWTSSDNSVVQILPPCDTQPCGSATAQGITSGTATITAAAQGLSTTAAATAYLGNITNFEVCLGTFGGTTCTTTWNVSSSSLQTQSFYAQGTSSGTIFDLTTASIWTLAPTPVAGSIDCDNSDTPAICTVEQGTTPSPPTYVITVRYGTSNSATANIVVSQ